MMHKYYTLSCALLIGLFLSGSLAAQLLRVSLTEEQREELRRHQRTYLESVLEEKLRSHQRDAARPQMRNDQKKSSAVGTEKLVSSDESPESEIHAAVNPIDSANIVIVPIKMKRQASGSEISLPVYYTRDFGQTWNVSSASPAFKSGGDPVLAFADDGTLFFTWLDLIANGETTRKISLLCARSSNGGEAWSAADTVDAGVVDNSTFTGRFVDKQWMSVDRAPSSAYRGSLYVIYVAMSMNVNDGVTRIEMRKLRPGGSFDALSTNISGDDFFDIQFPSIGVDDRGGVHAFFWGLRNDANSEYDYWLWHVQSNDGGATFTEPVKIAPVRFPTVSQAEPQDYLPQRLHPSPQFAVDGFTESKHRGSLYAVWTSNDLSVQAAPTTDEPLHVYFSRSSDYGVTWSDPVRLNTDNPSHRSDHFHASVEVSPGGTVIASWFDGRQANNNTETHFYTAFSQDGGAHFLNNMQVSTQPSNIDVSVQGHFGIGDYNKTVSTRWYAIPVWPDGRANDGNLDVYAAFIPLDGTVGIERISPVTEGFGFTGLYPNPAVARCEARFLLQSLGTVEGSIVDLLGREVKHIGPAVHGSGRHDLAIDLAGIPPGSYYVRLRTQFGAGVQRLVVVDDL